jgi:WD40 repeat protein
MVETLAEHSIEEASLSKRPTPKHKFEGHEEVIQDFVFLHNNAHVVSGSRDGTMRKWNCNTGNMVGQPWKEKGGSVYALALSPNGKTIACGREDGSVQRWKTDGKMFKDVWTRHTNVVRSLSWSPSGRHIASGSYDGKILIQKAESGEIEVGPIETKQGGVRVVAYSPAGDRILSGGWNSTVCVLDGKTGEVLVGPNKIPGIWVTSLVWSSDGSKFYSTSDKFARIFDNSGNELRCFEHDDWLFSIALSPKYDVLACVGWSGIVQLWDTKSDQPLGSQPFGLEDRTCSVNVTCVSFSRDGRFLAYGGADKTITLWTMKEILGTEQGAQHVHTETQSQSLSCLDVSSTPISSCMYGLTHDIVTV